MGCVSALGLSVDENLHNLSNEQTGISYRSIFNQNLYVGAVEKTNQELKKILGIESDVILSRSVLLGKLALKEALSKVKLKEGRTAFLNGMTVGGMDLTESLLAHEGTIESGSLEMFSSHDLGSISRKISQDLFSFDHIGSISTACSSSANAILTGCRMIEAGMFDRVIVGGVDALSEFTVRGFQSLMLYSDAPCKPFSLDRQGLNLGEGAAYLILESESCQAKSENPVLAWVLGGGNANDAHHITASSPEGKGAQLAMSLALEKAALKASDIDYVNAHGTSTKNNDDSETAAMNAVFMNERPFVSSTKSFTGHTLAACGAIEAVFSVLSMQTGLLFPSLNVNQSCVENQQLLESCEKRDVHVVMSNSFGFGGNSTSLIFGRA